MVEYMIYEGNLCMDVDIIKIKGDWAEVVDDCRATVKKDNLGKDPSNKFKKEILIAEHDPIRDIEIKFKIKNLAYWVAMHLKTHIWRSRTNTQRNDRQNLYDRNKASQDAKVDFIGDMNSQHYIDTSRKRLCYKAAAETRETWEAVKAALREVQPEISDVGVPNCVYRCGCPEKDGCGFWDSFLYWVKNKKHIISIENLSIQDRYDLYNEYFYDVKHGK